MNVDRLIHRIEKALRDDVSSEALTELASEYARYRSLVKGRLDKCMVLLGSQQDFTALEVAEQPPALFPLLEKLSFAKEDDWQELCLIHGLDFGPDWEQDQVDRLEKLYGTKMSEDSPVFREYRDAARSRDDERTFRTLRKLLKEHPGHPAAQRHYLQLSRKMLSAKIDQLEALAGEGREDEFLALMKEVETTDWIVAPMGAKWEKALAYRKSLSWTGGFSGGLSAPTRGMGQVGRNAVGYLRSLALLPKLLVLAAAAGTAWLKGGYPAASLATLAVYWAFFGFKRNAR